jgi:hypothetical protein
MSLFSFGLRQIIVLINMHILSEPLVSSFRCSGLSRDIMYPTSLHLFPGRFCQFLIPGVAMAYRECQVGRGANMGARSLLADPTECPRPRRDRSILGALTQGHHPMATCRRHMPAGLRLQCIIRVWTIPPAQYVANGENCIECLLNPVFANNSNSLHRPHGPPPPGGMPPPPMRGPHPGPPPGPGYPQLKVEDALSYLDMVRPRPPPWPWQPVLKFTSAQFPVVVGERETCAFSTPR